MYSTFLFLFHLVIFSIALVGNSVEAAPLKVTFVANVYTGTSKSADPNIPAIVGKAVELTNGKIEPVYSRMSDARAWRMFLAEDDVCLFNKIKTPERQKIAYYTKHPKDIYPPQRLYVHKELAEKLQGKTSLRDILEHTKISIGIAGTNNYGTQIMPLVASYNHRFFVLATAEDHEDTLHKMLLSRRVDGIFSSAGGEWTNITDFVGHPIDEADPALLGYIICPHSEIGRQAIDYLDQAMTTTEFQSFILNQHLKTFPESEHGFLRKYFNELYGKP